MQSQNRDFHEPLHVERLRAVAVLLHNSVRLHRIYACSGIYRGVHTDATELANLARINPRSVQA